MHCLGAVSGGAAAGPSSSSGVGNRSGSSNGTGSTATSGGSTATGTGTGAGTGSVMNVFRALGVLVCEGRIQGPPRGYKEGPHCAAPLQATHNNHVCEENNYLCERYLVLIREISDRTMVGSYLCVEVLLCSSCPCGLTKATAKNPVLPIPSISMPPWEHSSEILLEYWCIGILPSKGSETMNCQGLYQAVRSRLHFSQVAAWWSRSSGTNPNYIATRVVSHSEENLGRFRETPVEHTFPMAASGDGHSIKVTVWALPRMENVPVLVCPMHPTKELDDEIGVARALTPTKHSPSQASSVLQTSTETLLLPVLVDDRLQTPCNKPGKHHCRCEEEDGCPPSPCIQPTSERKRRRSLPCGPSNEPAIVNNHHSVPMPSLYETKDKEKEERRKANFPINTTTTTTTASTTNSTSTNSTSTNSTSTSLACSNFQNGTTATDPAKPPPLRQNTLDAYSKSPNDPKDDYRVAAERQKRTHYDDPIDKHSNVNYSKSPRSDEISRDNAKVNERNLHANPFHEPSPFHESNPGPSTYRRRVLDNDKCTVHQSCVSKNNQMHPRRNDEYEVTRNKDTVKNASATIANAGNNSSSNLINLMSKLSFPEENHRPSKEDYGIFDWFSKVPGRVLGVAAATNSMNNANGVSSSPGSPAAVTGNGTAKNVETKKNCNLELSQREFDEVLAVLCAKTPGRRRNSSSSTTSSVTTTPVKSTRKSRDASDKGNRTYENNSCTCKTCKRNDLKSYFESRQGSRPPPARATLLARKNDECVSNKADVLLGAILRTSKDRKGLTDISNGSATKGASSSPWNNQASPEKIESHLGNYDKNSCTENSACSSAPSPLNRRLAFRFRRLFKKEQVSQLNETKEDHPRSGAAKDHRGLVKRKILFEAKDEGCDFSNGLEARDKTKNEANGGLSNLEDVDVDDDDNDEAEDEEEDDNDEDENVGCVVLPIRNDFRARHRVDKKATKMQSSVGDDKKNLAVEDDTVDKGVPSAIEQERFRRSLENAASMVFHSRTGLPLTSSPAPLRRGSCCFDYDSSLNSVSSKRSALFELNTPPSPGAVSLEETDRETENIGEETPRRRPTSRQRPQSHALLGSFEESALNGRLEPVSTVHGFTAELGASGSFCPKHRKLPVTVFFYTLGDNDKVSTPYLAHINLGKKGYLVPRSGTIQVTLLNPLGTVVKMFVVLYDLSDMPPRSHTFLRQRTLRDKTLRYLVHLRFMSGKSGRIYLHTDIRMIICRKSDVDTAFDFGSESAKELRSYIHGPTNPKFSPRC